MKKLIALVLLSTLFSACEDPIPVVDPTALDNRNIYIRAYKYFDGSIIDTSTVYQINGDLIKFDHIYVTLSGARFVSYDEQDTTFTESDLTMIDLIGTSEVKLAHLPSGNYNGSLEYTIGLDSARAYTAPEQLDATNPLSKGLVWNGSDVGHSFFQMEGRIFNPADTVFTTPEATFNWRVATPDLALLKSEKRNFNVASNKDVFIVMDIDVDNFFLGLSPSLTNIINSDPADATDYDLAKILRDNVSSEFVFKL
ncbi:MAG: hypothetical protein NWR55_05100 [Schleiferiaceae bacterium]|jgi:hypothetical protein|nr:hypothetical protein [Schleiferiaceae bacterium]MDP4758720.1 hypothetical protein [Schleiferiaceae bacterium]MDP4767828.1 hypothetical protein [Schleiferiaceae bacterium]